MTTRRPAALVTVVASLVGSRSLTAQATSGASELLVPFAARAVGVGGATVADVTGGESILANPAALAWLTRAEGTLHYAKDFFSSRLLATAVIPKGRMGTFSFGATYVDFGTQEATQGPDAAAGQFTPRSITLGASYSASFGKRFSGGVTYSLYRSQVHCVGVCEDPTDPSAGELPRTTAGSIDIGAQYDFTGAAPVRIGAAVRHLGLKVQVQDREQADPLPTEGSVGVRVDVPAVARSVKDAELHLLSEVVTGLSTTGLGEFRIGAEGVYRKALALRAGFAYGRSESGGPAIGVGYAAKRWAFDLATQFAGFSVESGQSPTFVAFRYWF